MISRMDIEAASKRIGGYIRKTPVISLEPGSWGLPCRLTLKLELLQHSGSFKVRGAFNRLLSRQVPVAGVIAASGGNHGAAVAYAARQLGYYAEIFVPEVCPVVKVQRLRSYGAQVTQVGAFYAEAYAACERRATETGALMVHAYDQAEVLIGQGTLGREIDRQVPDVDSILVAVGGGGLIGGIASWFSQKARVIGVEPEQIPTLHAALAAGRPVDVTVGGIAADSLGARQVGQLAFEVARQAVNKVVLVEDEAIQEAQSRLWEALRIVAEPGGAAALAALISGRYKPASDEHVCVVVCGANVDLETFTRLPG